MGGGGIYLCRGHDGDSSDDLCPIGDLLFGSNNIWQSFLVFCVLLPVQRLRHLETRHAQIDTLLDQRLCKSGVQMVKKNCRVTYIQAVNICNINFLSFKALRRRMGTVLISGLIVTIQHPVSHHDSLLSRNYTEQK